MKLTLTIAAVAIAASTTHATAAVLADGPDAWARGTTTNNGNFSSSYYAWDVFDMGTPGPFGNSILNDSTPDIGTDPTGANVSQGDPSAYGLRSSSGNLYSGFQGDALNLDLTLTNNGTAGSGNTTVLVTFIGNPAGDREFLPLTLSDGTNTFAPDSFLDGLSDTLSVDGERKRILTAEWRLSGNVNTYTVGLDSDLTSGNGTDVAIDSVSVDIAWTSDAAALTNSVSATNLGAVTVIPEPSSGILALVGLATLTLRRKRNHSPA